MLSARALAQPSSARVAGAFGAILITALFLRALELPPPRTPSRLHGEPITIFLPRLLPALPPTLQPQPAQRKSQPKQVSPAPPPSPAPSPQVDSLANLPAAATAPEAKALAAPPVSSPAPLVIDSNVLRSAVRSSASPVRSMAGSTGVELGSPAKSVSQAYGEALARSAKSDCLASNENASLLSVFVIAYEAATGKCK